MQNNEVKIAGTIVKIDDNGKKIDVTLKTNSQKWSGELINEFPRIRFTGADLETVRKFHVYDRVAIKGHISTVLYNTDDGKKSSAQNIIGDKIVARMETNADKRLNEVKINGVIKSIHHPENSKSMFASITIGVESEDGKIRTYPKVMAFGNLADFAINQLSVNDYVSVTGYIQSNKDRNAPNRAPFIIVCRDLSQQL